MKNKFRFFLGILMMCILIAYIGCNKDKRTVLGPDANTPTYLITVTVLNPSGTPQGGVTLTLQNPPYTSSIFTTITDNLGHGTLQAPVGNQIIIATMGTVFQDTVTVNVAVSSTPTVVSTPLRLVQNTTTKKVLVVEAFAEQLETVLRVIGFTTFDETTIETLRDRANTDSTELFNYLKQYSLVFSDCDGNSEGDSVFAALSRTYGRYVSQGGKMYGGHYNYYHLQRIWPSFYTNRDYQGVDSQDSISFTDQNIKLALGFNIAKWNSTDGLRRYLSGYEKFSNLPSNAKVYGVIYKTSPNVGVIVENYIGSGKYLWTDYHNQDIIDDPKLLKIVQYFLLSL